MELDKNPVSIECDSKQTIGIAAKDNIVLKSNLRHVDIHNHWLRQEYARGHLCVVQTESAKLIADSLTKSLPRQRFEKFRSDFGIVGIEGRSS